MDKNELKLQSFCFTVGIDFRMDDEESNDFPTFRADHPFLYYIWDTESKSVIFIGHITKFN